MGRSGWYERNNFDDNNDYARKVLEKFDIKRYHFVSDGYGCLALLINLGVNSYRINVNYDDSLMEVYKKIYRRTAQRHKKEYMKLVKTIETDGIYNSIKFIKRDSEI